MSRTYLIQTEKYGTLRKADDTIADARRWAKSALGVGPRSVSREINYKRCGDCACAPCCCSRGAQL